jgi:FixJ family two-component response regulator
MNLLQRENAVTELVNGMRQPSKTYPPLVMVVDDDPAVCESLKFSLELEGFAVRTFGSGAALLRNDDFDACKCFVIDQRMPGMTGMELIAKLRDQNILTPAVLIISQPSAALSVRAKIAGVPIVEKPLLGDALFDRIRDLAGVKMNPTATSRLLKF